MRNVLEGVPVIEIRCMLQVLIQDLKLFTLATINNRNKRFPYGILDATRHITSSAASETLKQTGR